MSSMKGGLSTLNRWFGRKKDKSGVGNGAANGKLSKSTTQLHHMSTDTVGMHINEASQLEYNRITPLPAATSNAPFEQTFRITVLLPKDQLYVTRLGARVPLSKLLSLVCDNKQLDADKYEFRNPVDASQVFSCESTIGAVGLSEIRLCHKSESYDSFNADTMLKFQRTAATRDSLSSSSDFSSSRHSQSKLTAKTPSPYSSSNSINSMDSTGMNYTRTPVVVPAKVMVAPPPRKKRAAPRPPSQLAIPEQSVAQFNTTTTPAAPSPAEPAYAVIVKRPQLCMSTPNLAGTTELERELDCNGNSAKMRDVDAGGHYATLDIKVNGVEQQQPPELPEPTPRKRLQQLKKKTAPAPPPAADSISLASTTASITELLPPTSAPQPAPRITTPSPAPAPAPVAAAASPAPAPPATTPTATPTPPPTPVSPATFAASAASTPGTDSPPALSGSTAPQLTNQNVSKVLLNRTPTPEPRSLSSTTEEEEDNNDAASKQADSGIGEPVPSPSPEPETKSQLESSSEDEEAIKVYNFKTSCETSVKMEEEQEKQQQPHPDKEVLLPPLPTTLAELSVLSAVGDEADLRLEPLATDPEPATPSSASELTSLSSWNYAVPISPPPDFSDPLRSPKATNASPAASPLDEIVDELSAIISQQRLDTLIRQAPVQSQIEAAKPNRLDNFSIAAIGNGATATATTNGNISSSCSSSCSSSSATTPTTITRADSFQALGQSPRHSHNGTVGSVSGLGSTGRPRSSSQLSLNKLELNGNGPAGLQQRRSSSELSIAESPSLQSFELIKSILSNSRKNSLADSPDAPITVQQDPLAVASQPKSSPSPVPVTVIPGPVTPKPVVATTSTPVATPSPTPVAAPIAAPAPAPIATPAAAPTPTPAPTPYPAPTPSPTPISASVLVVSSSVEPISTPAAAEELSPKSEKPLPPVYRYSGPPSINFATWSERPKSQVAIKNEGDYIFGGAKAAPSPPAKPAKLTIEVASPILRMGIPRKEYHVPITVKPLRDVSVEESKEQPREQLQQVKEQPVLELEKPPLREYVVKPSTLPRPAKSNRYTLPAGAVAGMSQATSSETTTTSYISTTNSLPRPQSKLEKRTSSPAIATSVTTEPAAAPFGQNTLRRTGFKERMLAKEQQEKEQALRVRVSTTTATPAAAASAAETSPPATSPAATSPSAATPAAASPTPPPATAAKPKMVIRSGKLELKLPQQQQSVTPPEPIMLQVKLRPTSLRSTPAAAAAATTPAAAATSAPPAAAAATQAAKAATPSPPAAPPAPPALPKLQARKVGAVTTPTSAPDPRNQLLEAIRNFKREELNRA